MTNNITNHPPQASWGGDHAPAYDGYCIVDSTSYAADAKNIYGVLQDQLNEEAILINLLNDGKKFGKPVSDIGLNGYTFLARLAPNFNMGYRPEGTGGVGASGAQGLAQSTVNLKFAYCPVVITGQAENLTKGNKKAFLQAKALETKFDMKDMCSLVNVVMGGADRGGQLALTSAAANGQFTCSTATNLPGALYLRVGMPVDVMPVGGGALTAQGANITAINYTTGVVTIDQNINVGVGNSVVLAGQSAATAAAFPVTAECLISLISNTTAIQGLDPAQAATSRWQSFVAAMGGATISAQSLTELMQFVKNRGGEPVDAFLIPSAQINQLAAIATTTLRFDVNNGGMGKKALDLGFEVYEFAGKPMIEDKDFRNDRVYAGAMDTLLKFEAIPLSMAEDEAGSWTRVSGQNGIADAVQGLLRWYHQIGILQRSAWGVQTGYAVPADFSNIPNTL